MQRNTGFVWIPEAPAHPGLYANNTDIWGKDKINGLATYNVYDARQFETREECQTWCTANPSPPFVPREHGFYDSRIVDADAPLSE